MAGFWFGYPLALLLISLVFCPCAGTLLPILLPLSAWNDWASESYISSTVALFLERTLVTLARAVPYEIEEETHARLSDGECVRPVQYNMV